MKVNITLLTMITWAARRIRPPTGLGGPSETAMEKSLGVTLQRRGSSSRAQDECTLSSGPRPHASGRPTRLADGLGLESALIQRAESTPRSQGRALGIPRSRAGRLGIRLHNFPIITGA